MWPAMPKTNEAVYLRCNKYTFGESEALVGQDKSCWCEPTPNYLPTVCAEKEGDDCLCNGRVIFGEFQKDEKAGEHAHPLGDIGVDGIVATHTYWTVQDFNNTGNQTCAPRLFELVDPLPHKHKRCYCDEKKKSISYALE